MPDTSHHDTPRHHTPGTQPGSPRQPSPPGAIRYRGDHTAAMAAPDRSRRPDCVGSRVLLSSATARVQRSGTARTSQRSITANQRATNQGERMKQLYTRPHKMADVDALIDE